MKTAEEIARPVCTLRARIAIGAVAADSTLDAQNRAIIVFFKFFSIQAVSLISPPARCCRAPLGAGCGPAEGYRK